MTHSTSQSILLFIAIISLCIVMSLPCGAQTTNVANYQIELFGSAATNRHTPFWIVGNRYGLVPLDANNGYTRVGLSHDMSKGLWRFAAAIDVVAATPTYSKVYLQQAYIDAGYRRLHITIGSKENYVSQWDRNLSSGDMVVSANARPIPEINIAIPQFTPVPLTNDWLQFCGNFAVGHSFDNNYLDHFRNATQHYVRNILWHHKSFHLRFADMRGDNPLSVVVGIRHHAQWGGVSSDPLVGNQPVSFKDFVRIITGSSGGEDATLSDRINVLGNHYGSYDLKMGYLDSSFGIYLYKQHFFDDASGMELFNLADGIFGIQANLPHFPELYKIVFEYVSTRHQSGPVHHIVFDHSQYPGYGGGSDDYYNNGEYLSGLSYFNRSIGSPLLTSPEYNTGGRIGFLNNRIRAFHIGVEGYLSKQIAYRALLTSTENWGTMSRPFLSKMNAYMCAARLSYCHPRCRDWRFTGEIAADIGRMYGDNIGFAFTIAKTGTLFRK